MTRQVATASESTVTFNRFYGAHSDKAGVELSRQEYSQLLNVRSKELRVLKVRNGGAKLFATTENAGSKVYGLHTYVDDSATETYFKLSNGTLKKTTSGSWSSVGAKTDFASADTWFATLSTKDTGSSDSTSGTCDAANTATSLKKTGAGWTINAYVGQVVTVNNEVKRIVGNDADTLYVAERFDSVPASASFTVNPRSQEVFFANGTNFYKTDGTTLTQLDNSVFAYAFVGVEAHSGRLWGWKGTRLHWSDLGVGQHFSRNSWRDFQTPIMRVKSFGSVLVIYERRRVTAMFGDNPDNFFFVEVLNGIGTDAPKSVASYGDYQFFHSTELGICVVSVQAIAKKDGNEPLSISKGIFHDDLFSQSDANRANAAAETHDGLYHLCVDDDWYVLDIEGSFSAPRDQAGRVNWIFTKDDRPDAMDANVMGHFGNRLVVGSQDSGQVYEIEKAATYTDDGTNISWVIEKQDILPGEFAQWNKWTQLQVSQEPSTAACSINYYFTPGGDSYGSIVETVDLFAATTSIHKVRVTAAVVSDVPKNMGRLFSFKVTGSTDCDVPEFAQFNLLYRPGILR